MSKNEDVKNFKLLRSKKGYHVEVELKKPIEPIRAIGFRALYDDDKQRIIKSLQRYYLGDVEGQDVLFNGKSEGDSNPFFVYEIKGVFELLKNLKSLKDEELKDFVNKNFVLEVKKKWFCSVPIYFRENKQFFLNIANSDDKLIREGFFRQYSFVKQYDFLYIWQFDTSQQAFAFGMGLKEKFKIRTFFIARKDFIYIQDRKQEDKKSDMIKDVPLRTLKEELKKSDEEIKGILNSAY